MDGDFKIGGVTPPAGDLKFVQANGDVVDILHIFDGAVHIWPPSIDIPPSIITHSVTSIGETSAVGSGTASGGNVAITSRGIAWDTNPSPTIGDNFVSSGSGLGFFTGTMTPLIGNTLYYVRAFILTSEFGVQYGNQVTFTTITGVVVPEITTTVSSCCTEATPTPDPIITPTITSSNSGCCNETIPTPDPVVTPTITTANSGCCNETVPDPPVIEIPLISTSTSGCCDEDLPIVTIVTPVITTNLFKDCCNAI